MNLLSRVVLAGAIALSLTGGARAADMPPLPQTDAAYDGQPQELGTNWYLRGDIGVLIPGNDDMFGNAPGSALARDFDIGLGFGYDFGAYRIDASVDYFKKSNSDVDSGTVGCDAVVGGAATCTLYRTYKFDNFLVMLNGYYNLGDWNGLSPFIGAGIGALAIVGNESDDYFCRTNVGGTCAPPYAAGNNFLVPRNDQNWHPAGSLMAGLTYKIDDNLSLDATYRFVAISHADFTASGWENRYENQIRLGFRYKVD